MSAGLGELVTTYDPSFSPLAEFSPPHADAISMLRHHLYSPARY